MRERGHLEDPIVDGITILKCIFKKWDGETWNGLIWLKIRTGSCVYGDEPSGSIKRGGIS
jgi:hypothetical protein